MNVTVEIAKGKLLNEKTSHVIAVPTDRLARCRSAGTREKRTAHKLIEFHMALLKHGPNYSAAGMSKELQSQTHRECDVITRIWQGCNRRAAR